ncbi:hypothetical protein Tco_0104727 [Tanacetum coccineum]
MVPLRSDTIRLVQNGCSFHGLRSEDPNQHLKDFLKLVDSLDLDGSTFVGETLRKSDQLHQTFEKSSIAMTRKLYDMIELPKSQPKRTYNEDLECKIVMVKVPKCMAWLDDEPIGDQNTMEDKGDNPSPQCTPQVLPSTELYTSLVTQMEEVEKTLGTPIEVEPLIETKLEEVGLN